MSNQDKFDKILQEHSNIQAFVVSPDDLPILERFNGFSCADEGIFNEFVAGCYKDIPIVATANLEKGTVYALYKSINPLDDSHIFCVPDLKYKDN